MNNDTFCMLSTLKNHGIYIQFLMVDMVLEENEWQ